MNRTGRAGWIFGVVALVVGVAAGPRAAAAEPAVDAMVITGIDKDLTAVGRLLAGGMYGFGKFAPEAHIGFDGFLRIDPEKGIAARSFSLDIGARYGFTSDRFTGPYVSGGASYGFFILKPHERKVVDSPEVCASANLPPPNQDDCTFRIDRNIAARLGFGYGFASGKKTTVGVRVDVHYWLLSLNDFEGVPGAPVPSMVERPQDTWSVLVGLEFMRWQ
ncbi:MAG TPA: hypothetical protein VML75_09665 [Kofleriaceae bacterium]|nr:hypothetical protein [Kofleriaceae bacterium]